MTDEIQKDMFDEDYDIDAFELKEELKEKE